MIEGATWHMSARVVGWTLELFREHGVDSDALLEGVGLVGDPRDWQDLARIDAERVYRAIEEAVEQSGREDLLVATLCRTPSEELGVLAFAVSTSNTLMEGLGRLARYFDLWSTDLEVVASRDERHLEVRVEALADRSRGLQWTKAAVLAAIARLRTRRWAEGLTPTSVHLSCPRPASLDAYVRAFGVQPQFGRPATRMRFPQALADAELPLSNPAMARFFDEYLEEAERRLNEGVGSIRAKILRAILEALPSGQEMSLETAARRLGVGVRTLQRQLERDGGSFREIHDAARQALAERYLLGSDLTVNEIGYRLGFSSPSSFCRAFKNWTGQTPGEARDTLRRGSLRGLSPAAELSSEAGPRSPT